jgi:hypothetical protein
MDGLVERLKYLGCQSCAGNGTDRIAGVVCKSELMLVGESPELVENVVGEKIGGTYGGVVNGCNIDKVIDW